MTSDLLSVIKLRIKNPFYGSLILAFILWNWKAFLVLFYPMEHMDLFSRFNWLAGNLYPTWKERAFFIYFFPLVTAVLMTTAIPWLVNYIDDVYYRAQIGRNNKRFQRDRSRLVSEAQLKQLQDKYNEAQTIITDLNGKVQALEGSLQNRDGEVFGLQHQLGRTPHIPCTPQEFFDAVVSKNQGMASLLMAIDNGHAFNKDAHFNILGKAGAIVLSPLAPPAMGTRPALSDFGKRIMEIAKARNIT